MACARLPAWTYGEPQHPRWSLPSASLRVAGRGPSSRRSIAGKRDRTACRYRGSNAEAAGPMRCWSAEIRRPCCSGSLAHSVAASCRNSCAGTLSCFGTTGYTSGCSASSNRSTLMCNAGHRPAPPHAHRCSGPSRRTIAWAALHLRLLRFARPSAAALATLTATPPRYPHSVGIRSALA